MTLHGCWHARLASRRSWAWIRTSTSTWPWLLIIWADAYLSVRPFGADHRHVICSLRCRQQLPPDEQERTDDTVTSHAEASSYEVTTLLRLRVAVGRHQGIQPTSHLQGTFGAHVEGGSGRSEASPTAILQDTHSLEGEFCEVELRNDGVLRSWLRDSAGGIMLVVEGISNGG